MLPKKYPSSAYGKDLRLKISFSLWLILLFLLRPYVVTVLSIVNRKDKMGLINLIYDDRTLMAISAVAAIPATLVFYSWMNRTPEAGTLVRKVWNNGRPLLLLAIIINLGVIAKPLLTEPLATLHPIGVIQLVFCAWCTFVLLRSKHIQDIFADFPIAYRKD